MRLIVKQSNRPVNEFRFTKGPVYIGRHTNSQIFLPGRAVSRQHAVIFKTREGKWMVEDLNSANKTCLNDEEIHKAEIKTGDFLRVTDFTIEINLEDDTDNDKPIQLDDTLVTISRSPQIITRSIDAEHAPDMRLPAGRARDFAEATEAICEADSIDEVLQCLLTVAIKQFAAFRVWSAMRSQPVGTMTSQAGKQQDGREVQLSDIKLSEKITEAIEKEQFLLLPQLPSLKDERIQSAMIAPVMGSAGCFGVLYIDNTAEREQYNPGDLDYLMLLAIHTATVLRNF